MPEPLSVVEAFSLIYQSGLETGAVSGQEDYNIALIELHLEKYRRAHSFMKEATEEDYYTFLLTHWSENRRLRQLELEKPMPTTQQFWKAAYDIRFLGNTFIKIDLHKFRFRFRNLGIIPLGKLRGSTTLGLSAGMSSSGLPTTEKSIFESLDFKTTYFQGISYSDGHPTELEPSFKIRVSESSTLRRFICLGWVRLNNYKDWWDETGHVLVMDIDPGSDRRPWFVLASELWTSEEQEDGGFIKYVPARLSFDRDYYYLSDIGILPGDRERTSVGRVEPKDRSNPAPVLQQFGLDFEFDIAKFGWETSREVDEDRYGPDLAHIMDWYWDPEKEEFCCSKDGQEYLRYNDATSIYTYADTERLDHIKNDEKSISTSGCLSNRPLTLESRTGQVKQDQT